MNSQPRPQGLLVFSYGGLAVLQSTVPETMPLARLSLHRAPIETPTARLDAEPGHLPNLLTVEPPMATFFSLQGGLCR